MDRLAGILLATDCFSTLTMPTPNPSDAAHWRELDLLRAIAAILMILNHIGVGTPALYSSKWVHGLVFAGSFAPVLFFHLTGLGYGIQSFARPGSRGQSYLIKVAILLVADALLWLRPGRFLGNDFLGFIGLSMLLLEWIRRAPHSGELALSLALGVGAIRFGAGPLLRPFLDGQGGARWLGFLVGINNQEGFSYPPCPWLVYPFLGYALGRFTARRVEACRLRLVLLIGVLVACALLSTLFSLATTAQGRVIFRYSTMSLGFFWASLAMLSISLAIALVLCRIGSIAGLVDWISLSGVRSLAIVPLHYALCNGLVAWKGPVTSLTDYAWTTLCVTSLSFAGSNAVPVVAAALRSPVREKIAWIIIPAWTLAGGMVIVFGSLGSGVDRIIRVALQLALCVLLVLPRTSASRVSLRPPHRPLLDAAP